MSARVQWVGLRELYQDLAELPAVSTAEAGHIATSAANAAAVEVRGIYGQHSVTGTLQERVYVTDYSTTKYGVRKRVQNTAPHAHLFEYGTRDRQTKAGWYRGRMWGQVAGGHIFVPAMIKWRRWMYSQQRLMLQRLGASRVTGDA